MQVAKHLIVQASDTERELVEMLGKLARKFVIKPIALRIMSKT